MSGIYARGGTPVERDTTLRDLLAVVFKRKWLILTVFLVAVAFVTFQTLSSPVTYTADSTLLLNRTGLRSSELDRNGKTLPWIEVIESEVEVVRSAPVLQLALQKLKSPDDDTLEPIEIGLKGLASATKAGVVGESNVLYVSCTAGDPERAVRLANAVAQAYEEYRSELFKLPDASPVIQARIDSTAQKLAGFRSERARILGELGVTDVREEERARVQQRIRVRSELAAIDVRVARTRTQVAVIEDFLDGKFSEDDGVPFDVSMSTSHGNNFSFAINELHRRTRELDELRNKYTELHPQVREAEAKVDQSRGEVRLMARGVLEGQRAELRIAEEEASELRRQLNDLDAVLAALPEVNRQLSSLDAAILSTEKKHGEYVQQIIAAEVNNASVVDQIARVLSPALGARRSAKGDMVRLALGPILALIAGIGLAFYLENLDHSLRNREDVEQHLEIPVLASFPEVDVSDSGGARASGRRLPFQRRAKE